MTHTRLFVRSMQAVTGGKQIIDMESDEVVIRTYSFGNDENSCVYNGILSISHLSPEQRYFTWDGISS